MTKKQKIQKTGEEMGIDLRELKKWLNKNITHNEHYFKDREYYGDCMGCRSWRIYEELEDFVEYMWFLEEKF